MCTEQTFCEISWKQVWQRRLFHEIEDFPHPSMPEKQGKLFLKLAEFPVGRAFKPCWQSFKLGNNKNNYVIHLLFNLWTKFEWRFPATIALSYDAFSTNERLPHSLNFRQLCVASHKPECRGHFHSGINNCEQFWCEEACEVTGILPDRNFFLIQNWMCKADHPCSVLFSCIKKIKASFFANSLRSFPVN